MSEGAVGFLVLLSIVTITSCGMHLLFRRYWIAVVLSALVSDVLFHAATYLHDGRFDMFFPLTLIFAFFYAAILAALVGVSFIIFRNRAVRKRMIVE